MPSVRIAVWSCIRPGRTAPHHRVRPWPSLMVVVLIVFCLRLPETKAARPGRPAFGRRTWVPAPPVRSVTFSAPAQANTLGHGAQAQAWSLRDGEPAFGQQRPDLADRPADRGGPDLAGHAEGLVGQTGAQAGQGDQQPTGEHQRVSWPSAGLAPPAAAAPLAASGLASRLPPRREFGDKLAKMSP